MAVFAIAAADFVSRSNNADPHRSCGSLGHSLPLEGRFTLGAKLLAYLIDQGLHTGRLDVASQFGVYDAGVHSGSAHAPVTVPLVEGNSKLDICRLRSAIGDEGVIGRAFKVGIVEVNIGVAVTGRRQVDETASFADQRSDAVDEE